MTRFATLVCAAVLVIAGARAEADDDAPQAYDFWLDSLLRPHPGNPKNDVYIDGDTLTIHVDLKRLFPDETKEGELGFVAASASPEVLGLYVVGAGAGSATPFSIQRGLCVAAQAAAKDAAKARLTARQSELDKLPTTATEDEKKAANQAVADAKAALDAADFIAPAAPPGFACSRARDWDVEAHHRGYICAGNKTLEDLIKIDPSWSLVQKLDGKLLCHHDYTLTKGSPVTAVVVKQTDGNNAAQDVKVSDAVGVHSATIPIKANTRLIVVSVTRDDNTVSYPLEIKASARDTHSPVRVQAEILSTNRLRLISFAVAVSPVSRDYFTKGPSGCFFGCRVTAVALLRMGGEEHTVVQFGLGAGLGLARGFQLNGGVMFGSPDVNSAWRVERSWFFGLAIDPVILADVVSQSGPSKK